MGRASAFLEEREDDFEPILDRHGTPDVRNRQIYFRNRFRKSYVLPTLIVGPAFVFFVRLKAVLKPIGRLRSVQGCRVAFENAWERLGAS